MRGDARHVEIDCISLKAASGQHRPVFVERNRPVGEHCLRVAGLRGACWCPQRASLPILEPEIRIGSVEIHPRQLGCLAGFALEPELLGKGFEVMITLNGHQVGGHEIGILEQAIFIFVVCRDGFDLDAGIEFVRKIQR